MQQHTLQHAQQTAQTAQQQPRQPHHYHSQQQAKQVLYPRGITINVFLKDGESSRRETSSTANITTRQDIRCFRCGELGHFRAYCSTYRVKMCSKHRMGVCKEGVNCMHAHDISQLRQPWLSRSMRADKSGSSSFVHLGCGESRPYRDYDR